MLSVRKFLTPDLMVWCLPIAAVIGLFDTSCTPDFGKLVLETVAGSPSDIGGAPNGGAGDCLNDDCAGATSNGGAAQGGRVGTAGAQNKGGKGGMNGSGAGGAPSGGTTSGGGPSAGGISGGGASSAGGGTTGSAGSDFVPVDVGLPGTASADSEESLKGNVAANGHDGNPATRWVAADGATGHFWTLDLGTSHALSRLEMLWEYPYGPDPNAHYLYTVSVSDDQVTYTQVIDKSANTEGTANQVVDFPPDTSGRYVRITVTGLPPPHSMYQLYWASFFEAHVFGPMGP